MTCEEVKKLAKAQYGRDISDAEARAVLKNMDSAAAFSGELSDDALEGVVGGVGVVSQIYDLLNKSGKLGK